MKAAIIGLSVLLCASAIAAWPSLYSMLSFVYVIVACFSIAHEMVEDIDANAREDN